MLGLGLFWILSYVVYLAKLLFNFILEKRCVLIEMLLLLGLFKIIAHIHFIYHIQVQTSGLQLSSENSNSSTSPD